MTIVIAWERTITNCRELVVVSDSRLGGDGKKIDCGQKVFKLPRSDCFIAFAGATSWSFPLMNHAVSTISQYSRSMDRAQDIIELKRHILYIFDSLVSFVHDAIKGEDLPAAQFLFGGYSWTQKRFRIWNIRYDQKKERFMAHQANDRKGSSWMIVGDVEHVCEANQRLHRLMHQRGQAIESTNHLEFDWEPFEVVRDMLRDVDSSPMDFKSSSIGGAPQLLKVYEHLSSQYIGLCWRTPGKPERDGTYVSGRWILKHETPMAWLLDPDQLRTSHKLYSHKEGDAVISDLAE